MASKIIIENQNIDKNRLTFDIKGDIENGLDKSIINSIRRTLISSIPTVAFRTDINDSDIKIISNETALHNEFMLHRISLIPLYINPDEFKKQLLFYLKVESDDENPVKTIYSSDFEIYKAKEDIELEKLNDNEIDIENYDLTKPLNAEEKKKIFRPFEFRGNDEYCIITELRTINSSEVSQKLELYGSPSVSFGYENSKWCPVSCATYSFKKDDRMFEQVLREKKLINNVDDENSKSFETNLRMSESERYFHRDKNTEPYWYEFIIESVHYYESKDLFIRANQIIIDNLEKLKEDFSKLSSSDESYMDIKLKKDNVYELTIENTDDTIGNIIQSYISKNLVSDDSIISICGYKKTHPLENSIVIYLSLNLNNTKKQNETQNVFSIIGVLRNTCESLVNIYNLIIKEAEQKL